MIKLDAVVTLYWTNNYPKFRLPLWHPSLLFTTWFKNSVTGISFWCSKEPVCVGRWTWISSTREEC